VYWKECVPVGETSPSYWVENRGLPDRGQQAIPGDLELKPRSPRQLHLRDKPQPAIRLDCLDAPEVNSVADMKQYGM
jgi:hypothetical protein